MIQPLFCSGVGMPKSEFCLTYTEIYNTYNTSGYYKMCNATSDLTHILLF